ncbi:hypothetical protein K438DRAFT_2025266 [Mycena galopus ATCC 62051]|nr:hypothetical protein K438DRAFT_2025266 [Mycena galopus ATCC 62051]
MSELQMVWALAVSTLRPYVSWAYVHAGLSRVAQFPTLFIPPEVETIREAVKDNGRGVEERRARRLQAPLVACHAEDEEATSYATSRTRTKFSTLISDRVFSGDVGETSDRALIPAANVHRGASSPDVNRPAFCVSSYTKNLPNAPMSITAPYLQLVLAAFCSTAWTSTTAKIPFYIISNGETPSLGRPGLTPVGKQRAESCIPNIFSQLNIGLIITCTVDRDGEEGLNCPAANETAVPFATAFGINISTCATGDGADDDCPNNTLQKFNKNSNQSVLFVWDSTDMEDLLENVDTDAGLDNDQLALHPDLILAVNPKDLTNVGVTSMNCTGIDGTAA